MAVKKMEVSEGRRRQRRRITYKFFPQFFFLWLVGGLALTVLLPPGRRRRSSRTQLTAPVVVGWWIASCASPIWTCTRKSMSTPLLYVYVHTYIHVPCSTGSPPYHPRTQSTYSILWCPPFPEGDSSTVKMYMYQQSALNGKIHSIFQRRRRGTYLVIKQGPARTTSVSNVIE